MKKQIKIGYEVKTGKEVYIRPTHLVVTGITQESGKTTTLLSLIKRGKFKAVIFKTKIGEKSITEGTVIPPYYKDEFDWEYASEILEASRKEKLKFERSWIIKYSKTAKNLLEFKANIDNALAGKLRELEKSVLITLQAYLEKILPELQYAPLSKTLDIQEGINIMDLERFKEETQGLIIRSVLNEVLNHHKNTIIVLPECWKYLPERLGSPVKRPAEAFIRQGATNNNFLFLDSQDITGISKTILKQVSNWCLTPDTLIKTKEGYKKISQIKEGDFVLTHEGRFKIVKKVMKRKYEGDLYKIRVYGNYKEVEITSGHPILCESIHKHGIKGKATNHRKLASGITKIYKYERPIKPNPLWVEASKINKNHLLMLSIPKEKNKIKKSPLPLNKELMNLIGWYLAEGYLEKNIVVFTLGGTEIDEARGILNSAKSFGINGDFKKYDYKSVIRIRLFSKKLNEFLFDEFSKGASNKKIPAWIFGLDKNLIKKLLDSYTKGDGHQLKANTNRFKLSSVSEKLVFGIRDICLYLNYPASISIGRKEGKEFLIGRDKISHLKTLYVLQYDVSPERFGNRQAYGRVGIDKNYAYFRVRDIKKGKYSGIVYNLEVEDDNSYNTITSSVHNCLGYQREINEIKRVLDQIPLPKKQKPKPEDIASLLLGHFFIATSQFTKKVYVQPIWVSDKIAKDVALGKKKAEELEQPTALSPYTIQTQKAEVEPAIPKKLSLDLSPIRKEIAELRNDFFNKTQGQQEAIQKIYQEIFNLKNQPKQEVDEDIIVSKVLQKIPVSQNNGASINKEEIISEVLARVPKSVGAVTYEVAPLEKIKKVFLEEAKNKILSDIETLSDDAKKMLKYLETKEQGVKTTEIITKCYLLKEGGSQRKKASNASLELRAIEVNKKDTAGNHYPRLKERIKDLLGNHGATQEEVEQVYNHILHEVI